jgi:hypothetical protein
MLTIKSIGMKRSETKQISFVAKLENWAEGMDYCAVSVPKKITKALGTRGPVAVSAQINAGEPFLVSLFPVGGGRHYIRIKAKVRKAANVKEGDRVHLQITVLDQSKTLIPKDLERALKADGVLDTFKALPNGKRSYAIRFIDEAAKPETRKKRIQAAVEDAYEKRERAKH